MGITLNKKALQNGRYSLYLDYCFNGKRYKKYLGIILDAPKDKHTKLLNKVKLNIAQLLRAQREFAYLSDCCKNHLSNVPTKNSPITQEELDFFDFVAEYVENYRLKDRRVAKAMFDQLRRFHPNPLRLSRIDRQFCIAFLDYLREQLNGSSPANYFKKFKTCLNLCVEQQLIRENPANGIRVSQYNDITKNILSEEEIVQLALTPCANEEVKRAFLFSCHSGLRWCDIVELRYKNIDFTQRRITITQKKVSKYSSHSVLHLNLNQSAIHLLQEHSGANDEQVFRLPSHSYCLRTLKKWVRRAGILKHISYHCARHTFITQLMAGGANIKTAASLAGHSSTRHTERYIHIIDQQKQQAVDNLPPLPI